MFNIHEPRDTHGRWVRIGRGDLEQLVHAAVDARAHDIARVNGHGEDKAQQIQAHLRRQIMNKVKAAPVYNVRVSESGKQGEGFRHMHLDIHVPSEDSHQNVKIPHAKFNGNLEQYKRYGKPAEGEVDRPDVHGAGNVETAEIERGMLGGIGGQTQREIPYQDRVKLKEGVRQAAKAVARVRRQRVGSGAHTLPPENQARQMEAAAAEGRVGVQAGRQAAALIREKGGVAEAQKVAKGAAKKALEEAFKLPAAPKGALEIEAELHAGEIKDFKDFGRQGGINGGKFKAVVAGRKIFGKLDAGAYPADKLRPGFGRNDTDGPPERGAYLVGNILGVNGGIDGRMPIVVYRDIPGKGHGMLKEFVEGRPAGGNPLTEFKRSHMWMALDFAIANLDRHGANHLQDENNPNMYYPMDHGLAFPDDESHSCLDRALRKVWGKTFTPEEKAGLQRLVDQEGSLTQQLRDSGLSERRVASFWGRVKGGLAAGRFPNSEREAAQWGKPGRVDPQAGIGGDQSGARAAAAAGQVPDEHGGRVSYYRRVQDARGNRDANMLNALFAEADARIAVNKQALARNPNDGRAKRNVLRWEAARKNAARSLPAIEKAEASRAGEGAANQPAAAPNRESMARMGRVAAGLAAAKNLQEVEVLWQRRQQIEAVIPAGNKEDARSALRRHAIINKDNPVEIGHAQRIARLHQRHARGRAVPAWDVLHRHLDKMRKAAEGGPKEAAPASGPEAAPASDMKRVYGDGRVGDRLALMQQSAKINRQYVEGMIGASEAKREIAAMRIEAEAQVNRAKAAHEGIKVRAWQAVLNGLEQRWNEYRLHIENAQPLQSGGQAQSRSALRHLRMRNYGAMLDYKLLMAYKQIVQAKKGEHYERAMNDPNFTFQEHVRAVKAAAKARGLIA